MRRDYRIGPASLLGVALVALSLNPVAASGLELAAKTELQAPGPVEVELERAGFYAVGGNAGDGDRVADAISDFEHHIGWPETGRQSADILGALRDYNAKAEAAPVQF